MELIRGIHNIRAHHYGCVLTIGNFDGVHLGHKALLRQLKHEGQRLKAPVMVMIFEPQPLELFAPEKAPTRLTRLRDKIKYLAQIGVDYLLCVRFTLPFATLTAHEFITQLLVKKLKIKFLTVGDDFHFGSDRLGDIKLLQQAGTEFGFDVVNTGSFCNSGSRISSTAIRQALQNDDLVLAEDLLGHPYSITGRVIHGDELGRTLGFPTANISLKRLAAPVKGVYAVDVYGLSSIPTVLQVAASRPGRETDERRQLRDSANVRSQQRGSFEGEGYTGSDDKPLRGVANIGTRPTVAGSRQQLEVHIFAITKDLYGCHIEIVLREKLRNERCFVSLDTLRQQIASDVLMAKKFFRL
ncbi:bifunctional riboflavin kinase/FAD synthetase [Candidatus Regiella insecticola]|nr:bifunctional riboflavin kinase/FAD synthetase [Candidatus Regiella insecticola]